MRCRGSSGAWHHGLVKRAKPKPTKTTRAAKPGTRKRTAKPAARRTATGARAASAPAKKPAAKPGPRADLGRPITGFFNKQPAPLRALLEELRVLIEEAAPDATASLKWGMPFFMIGDAMMCALGGHKSHVNLILSGPPGTYADPGNHLTGEAKTGRHLKLTAADQVPRDAVRAWLRTAVKRARDNA